MSLDNKKIVEKFKKWKGVITFQNFLINSEEADKLQQELGAMEGVSMDVFDAHVKKLGELCGVRQISFENQIVLSGRSVFAMILNDETTYTGAVNYGAVGTGSTAISDADTTLDTEAKRKAVATRSRTNDSVTLRFFFTKADVSGTLNEFGTFIDGTSTADTGQLFNRALTGGWVKSSSEALTVTVQFDLNTA